MLRLILVRHGQSEGDILGRHEGRADYPLTKLGESQAKKLAEYLSVYYGIDEIYCSPLKRAKKTAELICKKIMKEPIEVNSLMEMDNGHLAGLTFEEANKKYPITPDRLKIYRPLPGGESTIDFRMRVEGFWHQFYDEKFNAHEQKTVCLVAHGGTISMLIKTIFQLPVPTNIKFPTGDTGFHLIEITSGGAVYIKGNCLEHLLLNK
ncbi:histidine phosphatase family protein [Alkalicella caledoniensis]|uniref:Histidine phosphatase family protein n=1 Tax=Alkalicella caledoniensis TaxID=2731377 RepID=A0A7G9W7F2_ALKCA|nr:histidine phosphatase family protein [Alkalicella caledoniensis]QNO14614.1 histidine phosphatase family protein [Alkalicella caledoniensis]